MTTRNRELASIIDDSGNITATGNLTVSGTTTAVSSTNTTVSDPLIELNSGASSNSNDLGFVFERGSTGNNAAFIWDESNDTFALGTTTATGSSTGNMSISSAGITLSTINGLTFPTSDGSANQILKTDGSGALSFVNPTVTSIAVENESGNGSTTAFTLSADPGTENNTQVYIDGVYQFKNTYTVSGTTLTFDTAPANGASIEIIAITAGSVNVPTDDSVSTAKIQNNAVTADKIVANAVGISELNVSDGSNGQALVTNGSGTLSFATISSTSASPTFTIGDGGAQDIKIVFDGNAQDFYIGLDDSADDLIIGKGSTVGTTPAIAINENQQVCINGGTFNASSSGTNYGQLAINGANGGVIDFTNDGVVQTFILSDTSSFQLMHQPDTPILFGTNNTERMRLDANVLTIKGPHASSGGQVFLQSTDASDADDEKYGKIKALNNGDTTLASIEFTSEGSANNQSHIEFYTNNGSALSHRMRIRSNGTIQIDGAVSKGSGSFEIPHPLESKKDTHKLRHSFIEGPQCDNIYRGKVTLSSGTATVNLDTVSGMTDGTFVALNRDIQVFTTNESDWNPVKGSVSGNVLTITCQDNQSTDTVSWMVIGERQDDNIKESQITDVNGYLIVEPENYENDT